MGSWGHKPLENDSAADLASSFNESKNTNVLEHVFDAINALNVDQYLEAPEAEAAVAAAQILQNLTPDEIKEDDRNRLISKSNIALKRVLENSELKELWSESDEYKDWVAVVRILINE